MITLSDYMGKWLHHPDATLEAMENASDLLEACTKLYVMAKLDGVTFPINPVTGTQVSGAQYGGFRPQSCTQGAPKSSHKEGLAVDWYDPNGDIDAWCMANLDKLEACGIYIEHQDATKGWSHWTTRRPKSGHIVFHP